MSNPILLVQNAGFGETPLPPDALLKPGDTLNIINTNDDTEHAAKILAVVPVGVPVEYALADQAVPPTARPLLLAKSRHKETLYVFEMDGRQFQVKHSKVLKGLTAACPDCLGSGGGSATDPEAKCETCGGRGRRDVRGAEGITQ